MFYLIYSSKSLPDLPKEEIYQILEKSREYNSEHNISGLLLCINEKYHPEKINGKFIQVLEGDKKEVISLYRIIEKDIRHKEVKILSEGMIMERMFDKWRMGFRDIDLLSFRNNLDVFELKENDLEEKEKEKYHLDKILAFIKSFYKLPKDLKI